VVELVQETPRVASLFLDVPEWQRHDAGQHVDVRLTADDGYQAQRSYSIASPPEDSRLAITVERLEDGEVSPYLVGEVKVGDKVELRGRSAATSCGSGDLVTPPAGRGGSGVVPLMAIIRHRAAAGSKVPARLLYSSRTADDIIYKEELDRIASSSGGVEIAHTLTRTQPTGWKGYGGGSTATWCERLPGQRSGHRWFSSADPPPCRVGGGVAGGSRL